MEDISDQAIVADVTAFLRRATANQKKQLRIFLQAQPNYSAPSSLLPMEELAIKIEIIKELRKYEELDRDGKPFHFSSIQISFFSLMSIDALRRLRQDPPLLAGVSAPEDYLTLVVQGKPRAIGSQSGSRSLSQASASSSKSICRNMKEREKCFLRDRQACILTKAALPEVCYIMPFAITAKQTNITAFLDRISYTAALIGDSYKQLNRITKQSLGSLDKSWNMLCLHPTLHMWWSKCLFGIKCIGILPSDDEHSTVQIQFHWMPRNGFKPHQLIEPPYDNAISAMLQTIADDGGIIADVRRDSFHELETGQTFEILVGNEDAVKMKLVLDLQWAAVRLAAISGAAGVWQRGHDLYDEDDDATTERVKDWVENLSEGASP